MKKERKRKRLRWKRPTFKKLSVSRVSASCNSVDDTCTTISQSGVP